jgi:hypothetical protein
MDAPSFEGQQTWGYIMESIDDTSTLRIMLQNPNGLKLSHQPNELLLSLQACHSLGVGILSLPETNSNWSKASNHTAFRNAVKQTWKH